MERYFLLRDNRESGPYSLKELKEKRLSPTDLIWVEEQSICWKNPTEIDTLKAFVHEPESKPAIVRKMVFPPAETEVDQKRIVTSAPILPVSSAESKSPAPEVLDYNPNFEEERRMPWAQESRKKSWRRQLNIGANLIGLVTFVLGVMMSAVMIKKAVDNIENEPEEIADVHYAAKLKMPASTTTHAALVASTSASLRDSAAAKKDTAVVKKEVKPPPAAVVKAPEPLAADKDLSDANEDATNALLAKSDDKQSGAEEEKRPEIDENAAKVAARAALQITANEYKVGLFGGVKNLQLTVSNPTSQAMDKVTIEVEFIKPNGNVVNTKSIEVEDLQPGGSKTVPVPDNGRGVSVRYRVVNQ